MFSKPFAFLPFMISVGVSFMPFIFAMSCVAKEQFDKSMI